MSNHITTTWLQECDATSAVLENPHFPDTLSLLSKCTPSTITLGTGYSVITSLCDQILATCTTELLFVTCFWSSSSSLIRIRALLLALSTKALSQGTRIRVRIGFSSLSLLQKLFHTQSPAGRDWQPREWQTKLGLPGPEELRGLDLRIKSLFVLPFCVMHPKFVVVDGKVAFLPSCNVSWERWFEGAVRLEGEVVERGFVRFWRGTWGVGDVDLVVDKNEHGTGRAERVDEMNLDLEAAVATGTGSGPTGGRSDGRTASTADYTHTSTTELPVQFDANITGTTIPTLFLPSHHHRNPQFRPFFWQSAPPCPLTPLNSFLLHLFNNATTSIYMQTPNLTSPPVLAALTSALSRGVSLRIITNERLMLLEQLVTAGTTTSICIRNLIAAYEGMKKRHHEAQALYHNSESAAILGRLHISYFDGQPGMGEMEELMPVSSHFKMTVVDDEVLVLGSGNMDRASWFTSQELGVAFLDGGMARRMLEMVGKVNSRSCRVVYDG